MTGSRYILLKGSELLGQAGSRMLSALLSFNANLFKAYPLKEEFRQLYRLRDEELSDEQRYREGFRRFVRCAEKITESVLESFNLLLKPFPRSLFLILEFLQT